MCRKTTFTLIELLVVIAIIAILTSILLPSLGKARDYSKMIVCQSNTKQIGFGVTQYIGDNDSYLPPDGCYNRNGAASRCRASWWPCLIYEYATGKSQPPVDGWGEKYWYFSNNDFTRSIFFCPATPKLAGVAHLYIEGALPFGMNVRIFSHTIFSGINLWTKVNKVKVPSDTFWFCETNDYKVAGFSIVTSPWNGGFFRPDLRHLGWRIPTGTTQWNPGNPGKSNTWFVDGHVSSLTYNDFEKDSQNVFRINKIY